MLHQTSVASTENTARFNVAYPFTIPVNTNQLGSTVLLFCDFKLRRPVGQRVNFLLPILDYWDMTDILDF